ncbi:hypothetical protein Tco_0855829, partial [Tanacetum coccineum]
NEMEEDVKIKNSNVSDEPVLLNTPLSDKVECFAPEDNNDEIDAFLAMEVSSNIEEGYFDSEGDITFLDNLLSDDASHNLTSEVISDHEPEQNESSIIFSPRSDPLHHEFAGEVITLPSGNDREFGEYLSLMTVLCEISTSQSQENVHANQSSVIESLPVSPIPVEDSEPAQEEIDIFLVPDDLIPPGAENDDSEDEDNELLNLDHQDDPSIPRPPPEPPDVEKCFEPEAGILITKVFKGVSKPHDFMADILPTLPTLVSDLTFILFLSSFLSFGSEDTVFDPGIVTFHTPVAFSMEVRIRQISQENRQKRANTNTEIRRAQKKPRIQSRSQDKSTMVKLQSKKVKEKSTHKKSNPKIFHNATLAGKEAQEKLGFALIALTKEAHMSLSRIAKLAIRENMSIGAERREMKGYKIRYGNSKRDDTTRERTYDEWFAVNNKHQNYGTTSKPYLGNYAIAPGNHNKPRTRDYSFKEWLRVKIRHTNVDKTMKNVMLNEWILDSLKLESNSSGISNDPNFRDLEEYKSVFDNEIIQLANEYELTIRNKGYILDDIWKKCEQVTTEPGKEIGITLTRG